MATDASREGGGGVARGGGSSPSPPAACPCPPPSPAIRGAKAFDYRHTVMDSTAWDAALPLLRAGDVIVDTYSKAGTSWVQAILAQLLLGVGTPAACRPHDASLWVEMRSPGAPLGDRLAAVAAQLHRRFLKSHLPLGALPYSPDLKYVYVARDARDVVLSLHHHHTHLHPQVIAGMNALPGRVGPPLGPAPADVVTYWRRWVADDGHPWWPFWAHIRGWWAARRRPNVLLLHFTDLLADLPGEVRRLAAFLDLPPLAEADVATIVDRCSFGYMRAHAADVTPGGDALFRGGARSFIHKGTNGRWRGVLPPADVAAYEATAVAELGDDCARWLAEGGALE